MPKLTVTIEVSSNEALSAEQASSLVKRLIDCGIEDARETLRLGEGDLRAASLAAGLQVSEPLTQLKNRVLVVVSGGVASHVEDDGLEVEVFDWDNHKESAPEDRSGVASHFADLATPLGIPVLDDSPQFLASPGWGHIFEGSREETTRWVYDLKSETLALAQILDGSTWADLSRNGVADLLESIHDNNATDNPEMWGLLQLQTLPSWQEDRTFEPLAPVPDMPRG